MQKRDHTNIIQNEEGKKSKEISNFFPNIEDKYSDKNLTNTEAQTIQKTLNDEDINFGTEENYNEEVSEEIISQLKEIVDTAPKLELKIIESLYFKEGFTIKLNSLGLIGPSLRDVKDGNTYFGIIPLNDEQNSKKIDFSTWNNENKENLNNNDKENIPVNYGRQFLIRFDLEENCYFIKDCSFGSGYGTFMKVIDEMKIKDNTLINIGNNYLVFTLGVDELDPEENDINQQEKEKVLSVKVFRGELTNYSYAFNQSQINKIYIGNNEECNIVLNDNISDEYQCSIEYKKGIGWVINDGYNGNKSENGTWISLSEETKITEGMIIQSNQNIYLCHIIK